MRPQELAEGPYEPMSRLHAHHFSCASCGARVTRFLDLYAEEPSLCTTCQSDAFMRLWASLGDLRD